MNEKKIITKTTYEGFDGKTYDAIATLIIDDDGTYYIDQYDYYDEPEWKEAQEREWDDYSIEQTFDVEIKNGKINKKRRKKDYDSYKYKKRNSKRIIKPSTKRDR